MNHPRSVWLVRHGQTDWNLEQRYLSYTDLPLTHYGVRQAAALKHFFSTRKIDIVIHSGLARTQQVAQAIVGQRSIPVVANTQWREVSHGKWEGLTYHEVMQRYPDDARQRFSDPINASPEEGESLRLLGERIAGAWQSLAGDQPNQRIVVVTHATPIQALLCLLTNLPLTEHWRWRVDLGSTTGMDCYPGTTIIRAVNIVPAQQ
jgi:2,3-bisphosphoglycerate-dependent phosphoglycerate mutase/probable phosphoglycerate mutase